MDNKTLLNPPTVHRSFFCGICGAKWTTETDQNTLDGDFNDLILPSREKIESDETDADGDPIIKEVHMKTRFRTVCYSCFFAISDLVELRKDLVNKIKRGDM